MTTNSSFQLIFPEFLPVLGRQCWKSCPYLQISCSLGQGAQLGAVVPLPRGHLAPSGDICGCHNCEGVTTGIQCVEARSVLNIPQCAGHPTTEKDLTQCVSSAQVAGDPWARQTLKLVTVVQCAKL